MSTRKPFNRKRRNMKRDALVLGALLIVVLAVTAVLAVLAKFGPKPDQELVLQVIDGDTIDIQPADDPTRVRLIGIDAPEQGECLYEESKEFLSTTLWPRTDIRLKYDVQRQDQYGRDLGAVFMPDGTFINEEIVKAGWARAVEYPPNVKYTARLKAAEGYAKQHNLGIHAVPDECLLPTEVAREAKARYEADPDPFYKDVMRDAVERTKNFTYREQALEYIDSL